MITTLMNVPGCTDSSATSEEIHDDLMALVERMLELNKRLKGAVGREREELERKVERTDREIDELVYELYGLTKGIGGSGRRLWIMETQRDDSLSSVVSAPP